MRGWLIDLGVARGFVKMAAFQQVHVLPDLRTRDEVQRYLRSLSIELGLSLKDDKFAKVLDSRDQLAGFRDKFHVPTIGELLEGRPTADGVDLTADCIYMVGNSLGLQPKNLQPLMSKELEKWAKKGLYGYFTNPHGWYWLFGDMKEEMGRIIGAKPIDIAMMNALTVNINIALVSFYRPTPQRYKILVEKNAFPSDHYAVEYQIRLNGYDPSDAMIFAEPKEGEYIWRNEDILRLIEEHGDSIALIWLSSLHYATGHVFNMKSITEAAHKKGCYVGFDLAHAVGNIELKLHEWEVDVAAWCTYKYLNSGPGSLGGFFVHEKHAYDFDRPRLLGWWAHETNSRLIMDNKLQLMAGADGFQISCPPTLTAFGTTAALEIFKETSMSDLCLKSRILTGYLEILIEEYLSEQATIVTSKDLNERGCHLSVKFASGAEKIKSFVAERGAYVDVRPPDIMRIAPIPLYNSFSDVWRLYLLFQAAVDTIIV